MPEYTTNLGLYKPNMADNIEVASSLAQNFESIDSKFGNALAGFPSLADRLADLQKKAGNTFVNVVSFGAVADGTDATTAFLNAIDYINSRGGGTLYVPAGEYLIDGRIELSSNTIIMGDNGSVLYKNTSATSAHVFTIGMQKGTKGYGGGAKNVGFINITFRGLANGTTYRALANTFNHAEDVQFYNCRFVDCITSAHALDLGGCNRIFIDKCYFIGAYNLEGREYTEAIQIDSSTSTALGDPAFLNTDALPTKNVYVRDCYFLPSYNSNGSVKNYAPNPIGNHGFTGTKYYENIVFENNVVQDGWTSTGGNWRAWIHFYGLANSSFRHNKFINTQSGLSAGVLGFYTSSGGRYDPVTGEAGTGTPLPHKNIIVEDNDFLGFRTSENSSQLIRFYGSDYNSTTYRVENIDIINNRFYGAGSLGAEGTGANIVQIDKYIGVTFKYNKADLGSRLLSLYTGWDATIENNKGDRMSDGVIFLSGTEMFTVNNNKGADCRRPLEIQESKKGLVLANIFDSVRQTGAEDFACRLRNLEGVIIQSNLVKNIGGAIKGYYVYQTSAGAVNNVRMYDNMALGFSQIVFTSGTMTDYLYRA